MAMSDGLGSMLGEKTAEAGAEKAGAAYIPYIGQAYQAYKIYKGFREGGIKGAISSLVPFGGSIFGGGGSRNKARRRALQRKRTAYGKIITDFERDFLTPQISELNQFKRDVIRGTIRYKGDTARSILARFEGMGGQLKNLLKDITLESDAGIGKTIKGAGELARGLASTIAKKGSGRGAGPDQPIQSSFGIQNIPMPNKSLEKPVLDLPGALHGGGFSPVQSEGHRFPVTTTQTPGGKKSRRIRLGETPGILT